MVNRDPDTGKFVSSEEADHPSYSDHEVQWVTNELSADSGVDVGTVDNVEEFEPIGDSELDNNEVAELRYMTVHAAAAATEGGTVATGGGTVTEHEIGINLGGDQFMGEDADGTTTTDVGGTTGLDSFVRDSDDLGQLYYSQLYPQLPFDDETNGSGGVGAPGHDRYSENFEDVYGGGPVVDATDDITVRLLINDQTNLAARATITAKLVWRVFVVDRGRPRFGMSGI